MSEIAAADRLTYLFLGELRALSPYQFDVYLRVIDHFGYWRREGGAPPHSLIVKIAVLIRALVPAERPRAGDRRARRLRYLVGFDDVPRLALYIRDPQVLGGEGQFDLSPGQDIQFLNALASHFTGRHTRGYGPSFAKASEGDSP